MPNFFTNIFSRPSKQSIPSIVPVAPVISDPPPSIEPPHVHTYDLIAKTVAEPLMGVIPNDPDHFISDNSLLGCTTYLWECTECGELRKEILLGSEESSLVSILKKVDEQGPVSIFRDGKRYLVGAFEEPRSDILPVR